MSVRRRKWNDPKTGKSGEYFLIDVKVRQPDGELIRVRQKSPVQTQRGSERYEHEVRKEIHAGTYIRTEEVRTLGNSKKENKETASVKFRDFRNEFMENYVRVKNKPSEISSKEGIFRRYLTPEFGNTKLDEIDLRKINKLKAKMKNKLKLSPKTINNATGVLSRMLHYAKECNVLEDVPKIEKLYVPDPEIDFLTFEEAEYFLKEAKEHSPYWYPMIFFAMKTGLRYGELCELRWSDVDFKNGKINVKRSFWRGHVTVPKNGVKGEVPLSPDTLAFLKDYQHKEDELVFCKEDGGRRIHRRAETGLDRICKKADFRHFGWHMLRHTFASHLVMKGVPLKIVQELMRHKTIEMTLRYAHLAPSAIQDAVKVLDDDTKSGEKN